MPMAGKYLISDKAIYRIILKGLHSKAQGKGRKAEGRQPATLGEDRKKKIP
jgi:hypothetical protein